MATVGGDFIPTVQALKSGFSIILGWRYEQALREKDRIRRIAIIADLLI
jgi:hypothetical protein